MLVTHPPALTDSFTLYVKGTILLGQVKAFNGRFRYRYSRGLGLAVNDAPKTVEPTPLDPKTTSEFGTLDLNIQAFIASIPKDLKDPVGLQTGAKLDPILYMAHMIPHMFVELFLRPLSDH